MKEFGQLQVINVKHTKLELEEKHASDKGKRKGMTMWDSVRVGVWMGYTRYSDNSNCGFWASFDGS